MGGPGRICDYLGQGFETVTAGLIVTWLYSYLSAQALPRLAVASTLVPWAASAVFELAVVSVAAEQAHRKHQARAPQPLRVGGRSWRDRLQRKKAPDSSEATPVSRMVGRATELAKLNDWLAQIGTGQRRVRVGPSTRRLIFLGRASQTRPALGSSAQDDKHLLSWRPETYCHPERSESASAAARAQRAKSLRGAI